MINNSSDNMYTNMHHYNTNMGIPPLGVQENGQQPVLSQKPMSYNTLTHNTQHNYPRVNNAYGPTCEQIYTRNVKYNIFVSNASRYLLFLLVSVSSKKDGV